MALLPRHSGSLTIVGTGIKLAIIWKNDKDTNDYHMTDDLEILRHPRIDILRLLAERSYDAYRLVKELGLGYRDCYRHLKALSEAGLIGFSVYKYQITKTGRQVISGI